MFEHFPAVITLLTLILLSANVIAVGRARARYGIAPPATTGNENFERVFRVQMNTQESAIMFLPALWLFSHYLSPLGSGILGAIWLFGRVWYSLGYGRSAKARFPGFIIAMIAFTLLVIGASYGVILRLISQT